MSEADSSMEERIAEVVASLGKKADRSEKEIQDAIALVKSNWLDTLEDFEEFAGDEGNTILKLPVKLYHQIKEYIVEKKKKAAVGKNGVPDCSSRSHRLDEEAMRKKARDVFTKIDVDKNESLDVDELLRMLVDLGEKVDLSDAKKIHERIDKEKTGGINFDQFYNWWVNEEKSNKSLKDKMNAVVTPDEEWALSFGYDKVLELFLANKTEDGEGGPIVNPYSGLCCIKTYVNEISELSTADGTLHIDISVLMWFYDKNILEYEKNQPINQDHISYFPNIEIKDSLDVETLYENRGRFRMVRKLAPFGVFQNYQRYRGTIRQDLDLNEFPFDTHDLKIRFADYNMGEERVRFVDLTDAEYKKKIDNSAAKLHEWSPIGIGEINVGRYWDDYNISEVTVRIPLKRRSEYYFRNIFSTVFCLNVLSWGIFAIPIADFGDRLNMYVTLFLSLVAFAFVIGENMPKVSHATPLTNYLTFNYLIVAVSALESFFAYYISAKYPEHEDLVSFVEVILLWAIIIIDTLFFLRFYFRSKNASFLDGVFGKYC